jgi:hypothetical protein
MPDIRGSKGTANKHFDVAESELSRSTPQQTSTSFMEKVQLKGMWTIEPLSWINILFLKHLSQQNRFGASVLFF